MHVRGMLFAWIVRLSTRSPTDWLWKTAFLCSAYLDAILVDRLPVIASAYREKAQLVLLLRTLKLSVEQPFQRLPTLTAMFLAEAACALAHPAADMYPVLNRHLLRRATLDLQVGLHVFIIKLACQNLRQVVASSLSRICPHPAE